MADIFAPELDLGFPVPEKPKHPPRFLLAHQKACDDDAIEALVSTASKMLDKLSGGKPYDLVTGRAYYEARFKACGSWEAWAQEIATGIDYLTRRPTFTAILVPAGGVGSGTAKMIEYALGARRPVYCFQQGGQWGIVVGLRRVSPSWQDGHRMTVDRWRI